MATWTMLIKLCHVDWHCPCEHERNSHFNDFTKMHHDFSDWHRTCPYKHEYKSQVLDILQSYETVLPL